VTHSVRASLGPGVEQITVAEVQRADDEALESLVRRAVDPHVPVEVFHAVLARLDRPAENARQAPGFPIHPGPHQ
jgi:hypothetical protein